MLFKDNYAFLSNMYECPVTVMLDNATYTFKCSESAYQACKCPERINEFIKVVAFWDGHSKGTAHNFELSIKYGNPIKIFDYSIGHFIPNPLSGVQ